jgi:hypothetical protein
MSLQGRIAMEKCIASATASALVAAGYLVSVDCGDGIELADSSDPSAIVAAMFATDEDYLTVRRPESDPPHYGPLGWIRFVYGNDGFDVISDYTTNLESILSPICGIEDSSIASRLESGDFRIVLD